MFSKIIGTANALVSMEIWFVAPWVAAGMLVARILPIAVGIAILFWLFRWLSRGKPSVRTPADWAIAMLGLMIPVTLMATALPGSTAPQVWRLAAGILLYYTIVNWASTLRRLRWLAWGLVVAGLLLALVAPFTVLWSVNKFVLIPDWVYARFPLLVSDYIHPNVMAGSLILVIPFPIAWLLFNREKKMGVVSVLAWITLLPMLVILALTKSRGAWIALSAALAVLMVLRWRRSWVVLIAGVLAISIAAYHFGWKPILENLSSSGSISTLESRQEIWSRAVLMIQDFPITGIGMGAFEDVTNSMYPFFLSQPGTTPHAHNLFLQIAVDLGIPGLIAWMAIWFLMIVGSWRIFHFGRATKNDLMTILGVGLLCGQIALIVHGLTDAVTWGQVKSAPLIWAMWGLIAASTNFVKVRNLGLETRDYQNCQ